MYQQKKKILICPLDWGLGHASRCIPIINNLLACQNVEVIIGASAQPLELLKYTFPKVKSIEFAGVTINYGNNMVAAIGQQIPKIIRGIKKEHELLDKLISLHKIDAVISDNRYGLWTDKIPCVFITHQLKIQAPFGGRFIQKINKYFINKYDFCWVPDTDKNDLAGELSGRINTTIPTFYLGGLSRFNSKKNSKKNFFKYAALGIVSGPEPQKSKLEKLLIKEFKQSKLNFALILGNPENNNHWLDENISVFNHLETMDFQDIIINSKVIVCRSGYSTIMDLATLQKQAIFIPTPGQTEQEYLAKYHQKKCHFNYQNQNNFDLQKAIIESENYIGITTLPSPQKGLQKAIKLLLEKLYVQRVPACR